MDITFHKVYAYDHVRQLLVVGDTFCPCKDTGPMNKDPIKAHKGIDNKIIFRALGPDRIPFDIACTDQVYARITDQNNNTVALEKLCRLGPAKGIITLELDAGDLAEIAAGLYTMVLIRTQEFVQGIPDYYVEKPLYSDTSDNVAMELVITEQAFKAPLKSIVLTPDSWTKDMLAPNNGPRIPCFYSSRIPGARILNHIDSVHSFSTYTENFTGTLEIFGSLEEAPDPYLNNARWFKIYPTETIADIEYIGYTGTQCWSFIANFMWLKFRLIPSTAVLDPGVMKKLIIRT